MSKKTPFCIPGPPAFSVAFSPDGSVIAIGSSDGVAHVMDATSGNIVHALEGHRGHVKSVAFSPDGSKIVSGSSDMTVCIWDADNGELLDTLRGCAKSVTSVAFSSDGETVVAGCADFRVRIWNKGKLVKTLTEHSAPVTSVAISSDGLKIVSGSDDKKILIWSASDGSLIETLIGHTAAVTSVAISVDGSKIVSGSADNTVRIWDAETGNEIHLLRISDMAATFACFSPNDKNKVVLASSDNQKGVISAWHFNTRDDPEVIETLNAHPISVAINSLGNKIAYGTREGVCITSSMSQRSINEAETLAAVANKSISKKFNNADSVSASEALRQSRLYDGILNFTQGPANRGENIGAFAPSTYYGKFPGGGKRRSSKRSKRSKRSKSSKKSAKSR